MTASLPFPFSRRRVPVVSERRPPPGSSCAPGNGIFVGLSERSPFFSAGSGVRDARWIFGGSRGFASVRSPRADRIGARGSSTRE